MIPHIGAWILLGLTVGCSIVTIMWAYGLFRRPTE